MYNNVNLQFTVEERARFTYEEAMEMYESGIVTRTELEKILEATLEVEEYEMTAGLNEAIKDIDKQERATFGK